MKNIRIGSVIRISEDIENENYIEYMGKDYTICHIAYDISQHPGYDSNIGEALVDCIDLPLSLYEYEFDLISY